MVIKIWILIFLTCSSFARPMGTEVGNGGLGVLHAKKIHLFDFFESSLELSKSQPFPYTEERRLLYENRLKTRFPADLFPLKILSQKLAHIYMKFPVTAEILAAAIELYQWRVTLVPLKVITFDFLTPVDITQLELVQVASRVNSVIYINTAAWNLMSAEHQAGLVFHEILYALLLGIETRISNETVGLINLKARQLNTYLWGHDLTQDPSAARYLYESGMYIQGQSSITSRIHEHLYEPNIEVEYQPTLQIQLPTPQSSLNLDKRSQVNEFCKTHFTQPMQVRWQFETLILSIQSDNSQSKILVSFGGPEFFGPIPYHFQTSEECLTHLLNFPNSENLTEHHGI